MIGLVAGIVVLSLGSGGGNTLTRRKYGKVQVGKDQEKAQSEKDSHF